MRALPILLIALAACSAKSGETAKSATKGDSSATAAAPGADGKPAKPAEGSTTQPAEGFTGTTPVPVAEGAAGSGKPARYSDLPNVPEDQLPEIRRLDPSQTSDIAEIQPLKANKP